MLVVFDPYVHAQLVYNILLKQVQRVESIVLKKSTSAKSLRYATLWKQVEKEESYAIR